jgi:hypothetical protein
MLMLSLEQEVSANVHILSTTAGETDSGPVSVHLDSKTKKPSGVRSAEATVVSMSSESGQYYLITTEWRFLLLDV